MDIASDERTMLLAFLDRHRDLFRRRCDGLTAAQLDTPLAPSEMTLGGMMKHLAYVENSWTGSVLLGHAEPEPWASVDWAADEDWDWHSAAQDTPEELRELYEAEVDAADKVIAGLDLDDLAVRPRARDGQRPSLRWVLIHLIEEYAQHNGHADLIRESIDGQTGS